MSDTPQEAVRRGPNLWVLAPLVLFMTLAGLFLYKLATGGQGDLIPSALIGKAVPDFELPALDGVGLPGLKTADLKAGGVTVVNVWASWCVPCRQEHPLLEEVAKDSRVRLVGINYKDEPENARRFLGSLGNPFAAIGVDGRGRSSIDWGVYGVPETFVIAPDGTIAYKHIGPITPQSLEGKLKPEIEKALARK
jgi:cytochrome c biogenesis protein CcmG/thiol:disulfide interchange protein DsbE